MAQAYYISSLNIPGEARTVEKALALQARSFIGKIISRSAVEVWAQDLRDQIPLLASKNMKQPEIRTYLNDEDIAGMASFLHIGCVTVALEPVMGEIQVVKGELVWRSEP